MSKIRNLTALLLIPFLFAGCTLFKKKSVSLTKNQIFSDKTSEIYLNQGKRLLKSGKIEDSNIYFDKALDHLFAIHSASSSSQQELNNLIKKISRLQLQALEKEKSSVAGSGNALIDEVVSTPLFKPSHKQIKKIKRIASDLSPEFTIPITVNSKVVSFITAFRTIKKQSIQNALNRSVEYTEDFKKIFREVGVPLDLVYLPIIESGYRHGAYSRARALGVWQFMRSTARLFGLRVDWVVDERRNPYKAAYAAAKYLKYLYDLFGDWYLALASYNGGPGKIRRAIRRTGRKDFFSLSKTRYLRRETRNYVPAFIASLMIAKSPEKYGFVIERTEPVFSNSKIVKIKSPVKISSVSKILNIKLSEIKKLNPELIRDFTPFNKKEYLIRIPLYADESLLSNLKKLPPKAKYFVGWYRVKRGDSLYSIARKFGTSVKKIKNVNKLRSNLIRPGKKLLIPRGFR